MAYIRNRDGVILHVPASFVQVCGMLRNLEEDMRGHDSSEADPTPIENFDSAIINDLLEFERLTPEQPIVESDILPASVLGLFHRRENMQLVELWKAADFFDYSYAQETIAAYLASKMRYAEPDMVATMFDVPELPTSERLEEIMTIYPYLREI